LPAAFSPARHWTAGGLLEEADWSGCSIDEEGVGETSGQRPDPIFEKRTRSSRRGSGRRNGFSSHGADRFEVRSFTQPSDVRSGPDVFAALTALRYTN